MGTVALAYVFDKKADSKDGLESEAIEALVKAWPDSAKPFLFRALRDDRYLARQNATYWLGKLGRGAFDAVESIYAALQAKRISPRRAAQAFGDIGDSLIVPRILYLLTDTFQPSRIVTAEACGKLKNPAAIPALVRNLGDRFFTARSAAEAALVATGRPSVEPLLAALPKMKSPALGHAVRALGSLAAKLDSTDTLIPVCRSAIAGQLNASAPFVRLVAVEAAGKLLDDSLRVALVAARDKEADEFVRTTYRLVLDKP
jgi:HEAT repeat protein